MISTCWFRPLFREGGQLYNRRQVPAVFPWHSHILPPVPRAGRRAGCESPGLVVKHYITKALRGGHPDTPAYRAGCQQHCTQSPSPSWNWAELRTQTLRQNDTWHFSGMVRTRTQAKCQMCHLLSSFCTELRTAGHQNHSSRPDPRGYH